MGTTYTTSLSNPTGALGLAGLTANPKKCFLGQKETQYLGFQVGQGWIKPLADKVKVIRSYWLLNTKKQLRSLLGLVNYYVKFIPWFSELSAPLTELVKGKKGGLLQWLPTAVIAFEQIKKALCQSSVLYTLDFAKTCFLQTNASGVVLGTVLTQ